MNKELDKALVRDFPHLYADRYSHMKHTAMCWGFPGDGWEPLIRRLSEKLELLIVKLIKDNPNMRCTCGCTLDLHTAEGPCTSFIRVPLLYSVKRNNIIARIIPPPSENRILAKLQKYWRNSKYKISYFIRRMIYNTRWWIVDHTPIYKKQYCPCTEYYPNHPRASQVKEKFGELRFYMTSGTDEIWDLIDEATIESRTICEKCGKPGQIEDTGWLICLCNECRTKRENI